MRDQLFVTHWRFDAPPPRVWPVVSAVEQWPRWWPGVRRAEQLPPGPGGRRFALRFRSRLGYALAFVAEVVLDEPPWSGEARVAGQLTGTARWELRKQGSGTLLTWTWQVTPQLRWMRLLWPVARPLFVWAHADLMRRGRRGLAARLDAT